MAKRPADQLEVPALKCRAIELVLPQLDDSELSHLARIIRKLECQRKEIEARERDAEITRIVAEVLAGTTVSDWRPKMVYDDLYDHELVLANGDGISIAFSVTGFTVASNEYRTGPRNEPKGSMMFKAIEEDGRRHFTVDPTTPDYMLFPTYVKLGELLWEALAPHIVAGDWID